MSQQRHTSSKEQLSPIMSKPVSGIEAGEMNKSILLNKQVRESDADDTPSNWSTASVCGSNSETSPTASISGGSATKARNGTTTISRDVDGEEYDDLTDRLQEGHNGVQDKVKQKLINTVKFR